MPLNTHPDLGAVGADPFFERGACAFGVARTILGARFHFACTHPALLEPVEAAYGGLAQDEGSPDLPVFHVEIRLVPRDDAPAMDEPPPVVTRSGAGLLCGVMDASNYVIVDPAHRRAFVAVSSDMLAWPYHVRYELVEFAVFLLAARGMHLLPLHAACVGHDGRGMLLLGASGAGKSTLALHSLLDGLAFVAEDAIFVDPLRMAARGVGNFLHVRDDALRFIDDAPLRRWIASAPVIRRRSGVEKFEADLRVGHGRVATAPLPLAGAVFVSADPASSSREMVSRLSSDETLARLVVDQPYAAAQPGWDRFARQLAHAGAYVLRRGSHPRDGVRALRDLLAAHGVASAASA